MSRIKRVKILEKEKIKEFGFMIKIKVFDRAKEINCTLKGEGVSVSKAPKWFQDFETKANARFEELEKAKGEVPKWFVEFEKKNNVR